MGCLSMLTLSSSAVGWGLAVGIYSHLENMESTLKAAVIAALCFRRLWKESREGAGCEALSGFCSF